MILNAHYINKLINKNIFYVRMYYILIFTDLIENNLDD